MTYAGIPATTSSPFNKLCSYSSLTLRKIFMVVRASPTWIVSGHSDFDEEGDKSDGREWGDACGREGVLSMVQWGGSVSISTPPYSCSSLSQVPMFSIDNCADRQFSFPPLIQFFRLGLLSPPPPLSLLYPSFRLSIHNWRERESSNPKQTRLTGQCSPF